MSTLPFSRPDDPEIDEIRSLAAPRSHARDLDPLVRRLSDARLVLLGEASHGTSDYYAWRARISQRLIAEHGFSFVAVEGDWPDCFRVNRWVKGRADRDRTARAVLGDYDRWPMWMWANEEVAQFVTWLRDHNRATGSTVGFYGLDVYSLWESLHAIIGYLHERRPDALDAAHDAFACFDPYAEDPQAYARATRMVPHDCEDEAIELLMRLRTGTTSSDGDPEAELDARQNAEVLVGAERYYRTMVRADGESWNVRDTHMTDTLDRLVDHHGPHAKAIVWEHNTHVGDARSTDMAKAGMVNVGQLARERHGTDEVALVGFGGHRGSVIAADFWGAPMRAMAVPPAPAATHEDLLHRALGQPAVLTFPERRDTPWLSTRHGHRAIGVVYRSGEDRAGNWVPTVMGRRYDALVSFDTTSALHPLHLEAAQPGREHGTYPWST